MGFIHRMPFFLYIDRQYFFHRQGKHNIYGWYQRHRLYRMISIRRRENQSSYSIVICQYGNVRKLTPFWVIIGIKMPIWCAWNWEGWPRQSMSGIIKLRINLMTHLNGLQRCSVNKSRSALKPFDRHPPFYHLFQSKCNLSRNFCVRRQDAVIQIDLSGVRKALLLQYRQFRWFCRWSMMLIIIIGG